VTHFYKYRLSLYFSRAAIDDLPPANVAWYGFQ